MDWSYFKDRKVLITGHTGFKGSWLCKVLLKMGADVIGYSCEPPTVPSLYNVLGLSKMVTSIIGDIRDLDMLSEVFEKYKPEVVIHLAAQPLVRLSYAEPRMTYETNVMGTVNICECVRNNTCVKSFLNVTTDKVYKNREWCYGYRENEPLDGFDPYSNSKSCSELITHSYINSFFTNMDVAVSTARAGNVIGGGDFALDRIVPDCVRAVKANDVIKIRNPHSIRPYQHVLEPLLLYLVIIAEQAKDKSKAGFYNVGPDECDCVTTGELVRLFGKYYGDDFKSEIHNDYDGPHEANFLKLDTSLIKYTFNWKPTWHIEEAIEKTVEWTKEWLRDDSELNMNRVVDSQIEIFLDN